MTIIIDLDLYKINKMNNYVCLYNQFLILNITKDCYYPNQSSVIYPDDSYHMVSELLNKYVSN